MIPSSPTYQRALTTFGFDHQADKTIEELGELITALQHFRFKDAAPELVITELADVMIMCQQLACHFGIDKVQSEIIFKLNRLKETMSRNQHSKDEYSTKPLLAEDDVKAKLDSFMQAYYFAARRENNFRMLGFEEYDGKTVLRLSNDASIGTSHYVVSHEQDDRQQDHFYMHLFDDGQEIFKSREMPHDRDDAYSFLRGAAREQADYECEKSLG
ncbi:MAG: hypothetical protein HUK14_06115 [Muribaculaceae bacterium]|nr:hypothetical protein [Muribaculaceae bacterium]